MIGALERPADSDQRAMLGHAAREIADGVGRKRGDLRSPVRILCDAVAFPCDVGSEFLPPDAMGAQEAFIVQVLGDQRMREREHQRRIRIRARRQPCSVQEVCGIVLDGADGNELHAPGCAVLLPLPGDVPAETARVDLSVLQRQSAERDHKFAVRCNLLPSIHLEDQLPEVPHDVGHHHLGRGGRIGVLRKRVTAEQVQEPPHLALCMMETAGARPAVGSGKDRLVAVCRFDTCQFCRDPIKRFVPGYGDERLFAAGVAAALRPVLQPTPAYHRLRNPHGIDERARNGLADGRGIQVAREGAHAGHAPAAHLRLVGTPVGYGRHKPDIRVEIVHVVASVDASGRTVECCLHSLGDQP